MDGEDIIVDDFFEQLRELAKELEETKEKTEQTDKD